MKSLRRMAHYATPYRRQALFASFLIFVEVLLDFIQPRLIQHIVDQGIAQSNMNIVVKTGLWMIGLAIAGVLLGIGNVWFGVWVAARFEADIRSDLFRKIQIAHPIAISTNCRPAISSPV